MNEQYALLLKNVKGHKELDCSSHPKSYETIDIAAGSLMEYISSADVLSLRMTFKVNYSVYSSSQPHNQSGILLFASSDQLYKLTPKQKDLLLAVDLVTDRVEVLEKLHWVEFLAIGSEVYTSVDTVPIPVKGVIRYIGELAGAEGTRFGIELMVRVVFIFVLYT